MHKFEGNSTWSIPRFAEVNPRKKIDDKSVKKFEFITEKFRWALTTDFKDQNGIQVTVLILDQISARITKVAYSVSKSQ